MDIYEYTKSIGTGMYGQVYLAYHKLEAKNYAIKRINFKDINQKDRENIENEVQFLQELHHPNIVSYKDSFCDRDNFFNIVMVYCEGGDIYTKIKSAKGKYFTENEIIDWIVQLGLALSYVHDKKILHRDLKTQNIFLKDGKVRIGDFGIAKMFNNTKDLANSMVGTPLYMSPEHYNNKKYGFKSDIWALGCCLFEICNHKHAFEGLTWNAVALKVLSGHHAPINDIYSKDLRNLIDEMLSVNPKNRPSINRILIKPFIKKRCSQYIYDLIQSYKIDPKQMQGEEIQIEIIKEQAEKLGLFNQFMKEIYNDENDLKNKNVKENISSYLKKKEDEKKKLETKIKELETQKKKIIKSISKKVVSLKEENKKENSSERKLSAIKPKDERSRDISKNKIKNFNHNQDEEDNFKLKPKQNDKQVTKKRPESLTKERKISYEGDNKIPINKNNFNSEEYQNDVLENSQKSKISEKKIHKSISGIEKEENSKEIKQKNLPKFGANTKSNNLNSISSLHEDVSIPNKIESKKNSTINPIKVKSMSKKEDSIDEKEVLNTIREENIDDSQINTDKAKLMMLTSEINKMKEILEKTNTKIEKIYIEKSLDPDEINNSDYLSENEELDLASSNQINNGYNSNNDEEKDDGTAKLMERIKFLKYRCEAALGNKLYQKAYEYLKANSKSSDSQTLREHLINLFGKNNIGFWLLIDQILYIEELLNS